MKLVTDREIKFPVLKTTLIVDAMYLHFARTNFRNAVKQEKCIAKAQKGFARLDARSDRILKVYDGDSVEAYSELEPVYIAMEGAEYNIGKAYGPFLQSLAAVHILAAACLESHINNRASEKLSGKLFDMVQRFSIEAKWVTLPRLVGLKGFDVGTEPYQGFARLVRYRNELIHYKPRGENWESPGVPSFLKDLGLTKEATQKSLDTAASMITVLAKQFGEEKPYWLRHDEINYFDVVVEK